MLLFSIETVPVPCDAEAYIGDKSEYTQIILQGSSARNLVELVLVLLLVFLLSVFNFWGML